jgi:surface antigen
MPTLPAPFRTGLIGLIALVLAAPVLAEPPPHAKAHGWRKKNDPTYVGYTGKTWPQDYGITSGRCQTDVILGTAGAAVGGVLGAQVGDGSGRTVAILAGAALGAIVGASIGRELDQADAACIGHALELAPPGQAVRWTDPQGIRFELVPVKNIGSDCRQFRLDAIAKDKKSWGTQVACRSGDGVWKLRS